MIGSQQQRVAPSEVTGLMTHRRIRSTRQRRTLFRLAGTLQSFVDAFPGGLHGKKSPYARGDRDCRSGQTSNLCSRVPIPSFVQIAIRHFSFERVPGLLEYCLKHNHLHNT